MTYTGTNGRRTRIAAALLASAAAVALAGCSSTAKPGANPLAGTAAASGSITVGSNNFPESKLLADIYGEALKAKGLTVVYKYNIGSREVSYGLLKSGAVTVMPEYNGSLLGYLDKTATPKTADDTDAQLTAKLPATLELLKPADAQDNDSLTLSKTFADAHKLTKDSDIADLVPFAKDITLGAAPEFQTRQQGLLGLKSVYGLTFKGFKALDPGGPLTKAALKQGDIQVGDVFTVDADIAANGWVTLKDSKGLFGFQNVIPVAQKGGLPAAGVDALNAVSAKLDTATLMDLDAKVASGTDPLAAADTWLKANGLS